mmetsp:Transcript_61270/g.138246  ORF Transcript_61270/g.138246 Transcript_61270/m.138246 type:complete len:461 (-) Transcript_61270:97-1479(-)
MRPVRQGQRTSTITSGARPPQFLPLRRPQEVAPAAGAAVAKTSSGLELKAASARRNLPERRRSPESLLVPRPRPGRPSGGEASTALPLKGRVGVAVRSAAAMPQKPLRSRLAAAQGHAQKASPGTADLRRAAPSLGAIAIKSGFPEEAAPASSELFGLSADSAVSTTASLAAAAASPQASIALSESFHTLEPGEAASVATQSPSATSPAPCAGSADALGAHGAKSLAEMPLQEISARLAMLQEFAKQPTQQRSCGRLGSVADGEPWGQQWPSDEDVNEPLAAATQLGLELVDRSRLQESSLREAMSGRRSLAEAAVQAGPEALALASPERPFSLKAPAVAGHMTTQLVASVSEPVLEKPEIVRGALFAAQGDRKVKSAREYLTKRCLTVADEILMNLGADPVDVPWESLRTEARACRARGPSEPPCGSFGQQTVYSDAPSARSYSFFWSRLAPRQHMLFG